MLVEVPVKVGCWSMLLILVKGSVNVGFWSTTDTNCWLGAIIMLFFLVEVSNELLVVVINF